MRGGDGNRTRIQGFAGPCLSHSATPPQGQTDPPSGRRDSNPRPSPWQGDALPTEPRPRTWCVQNCSRSCRSRKLQTGKPGRPSTLRRWSKCGWTTVKTMTVPDPVPYDTDIAGAAALIADPTRAAILRGLLSGRPLAAGELARLAGVSAATASFHLAKLTDGGLIDVARQGRHRYYRLAGHEVAAALEAIGLISPPLPVRSLRQSREAAALAEARTCYDHLAGRAGVGLLDALLRSKSLVRTEHPSSAPTRFEVTVAGARTL